MEKREKEGVPSFSIAQLARRKTFSFKSNTRCEGHSTASGRSDQIIVISHNTGTLLSFKTSDENLTDISLS